MIQTQRTMSRQLAPGAFHFHIKYIKCDCHASRFGAGFAAASPTAPNPS